MSHTEQMREALEKIAAWDSHDPMLGVNRGSNGVRDFYRQIAQAALTAPAAEVPEAMSRQQIEAIMTEHYPLESLLRESVDAFEACVRDVEKARDARWQSTRLRGGVPEAWGWAIVDKDGHARAYRTRHSDFFGGTLELEPLSEDDAKRADQDWQGCAPHRVVTLYTAAPQAPAADAGVDAGVVRWEPLTPARLSSEEFDGLYWLALKGGDVVAGEYEWRQGRSPDGFNTQEQGRVSAGDVTHIARFEKPQPPAIDAAMSAQAERDQGGR